MIDHVEFRVKNFPACKEFFELTLAPLGIKLAWSSASEAGFCHQKTPHIVMLLISAIEPGYPATRVHLSFQAQSRAEVDEFYRVGIDAGYESIGAPGLRKDYGPGYYAAFLQDPASNNIEALYREQG